MPPFTLSLSAIPLDHTMSPTPLASFPHSASQISSRTPRRSACYPCCFGGLLPNILKGSKAEPCPPFHNNHVLNYSGSTIEHRNLQPASFMISYIDQAPSRRFPRNFDSRGILALCFSHEFIFLETRYTRGKCDESEFTNSDWKPPSWEWGSLLACLYNFNYMSAEMQSILMSSGVSGLLVIMRVQEDSSGRRC